MALAQREKWNPKAISVRLHGRMGRDDEFPDQSLAALDFFASKRSSTKEGVAVPSQYRFAHYYEMMLKAATKPNLPTEPPSRPLVLKFLHARPVPTMNGIDPTLLPSIEVLNMERLEYGPIFSTVGRAFRFVYLLPYALF